ncbi:MAG: type II toxin-antitoxin system VapC family toxin [Actinomycetota bacterium]|nr:type II toxin-antitoxin system VapC family toxin [Actinomycetota bacterium]
MIYLDSSALVKLVRLEDGSSALQEWLDERADELQVTSELAGAEVIRAVRRAGHTDRGELIDGAALTDQLGEAADVLAAVAQVAVDRDVLDRAGELCSPVIRTLDAIHLVSAAGWDPADVQFVTYDLRLGTAARDAGMTVAAPVDPPVAGETSVG